MPYKKEFGYNLIDWGNRSRQKYWVILSTSIIKEFGEDKHKNVDIVNKILKFSIDKLINLFNQILINQKDVNFYKYVLKNSDNYFKVLLESESASNLKVMDYEIFVSNRKVLKLILEQTCRFKLKKKTVLSLSPFNEYEEILEDLLYIGSWIYHFADKISLTKFNRDFWEISFDKDKLLIIKSKHEVYPLLIELAKNESTTQYKQAINNATPDAINELKQEITNNFVDYDCFFNIIKNIQEHFLKNDIQYIETKDSSMVDIEYGIIEKNLKNQGFEPEKIDNFISGLTLSNENQQNILDVVIRPHKIDRFHYRPLLKVEINNEIRIITSIQKILESMIMLRMNALPYGNASNEWQLNTSFNNFIERIKKERGDSLEEKGVKILSSLDFIYDNTVTDLKKRNNQNISLINDKCGEIDLLYIDHTTKKIIVADCKLLKMRTESVGYNMDLSKFKEDIEPQMDKKVKYLMNNISLVEEHFYILKSKMQIDLTDYQVEGIIIINTPTLYMYFNSKYKILTLSMFYDFLVGNNPFKDIKMKNKIYKYPYLIIN